VSNFMVVVVVDNRFVNGSWLFTRMRALEDSETVPRVKKSNGFIPRPMNPFNQFVGDPFRPMQSKCSSETYDTTNPVRSRSS